MVVPILLAGTALAGAAAVLAGRRLGWLPLAVSAALSLLVVLALVVLFALLGGGRAMWAALLLLVGPLGALILALGRPVRGWTDRHRASRSPGGRRTGGPAR
jgi:peptidoglycan/LPS O-acetylase OafA/YrhL